MASILDILNLKLQQAQDKFHEYSSSIIEGLNTGNIKSNVNKKLSIISYWLEMLEAGIPNCEESSLVDPMPISITIDHDLIKSIPGELGCIMFEYFWIRNTSGEMVPLAKVGIAYRADYDNFILLGEPYIDYMEQNWSIRRGFDGGACRPISFLSPSGNQSIPSQTLTALINSDPLEVLNYLGARGNYNNADGAAYSADQLSHLSYYGWSGVTTGHIKAELDMNHNEGYTIVTLNFYDVGAKYNGGKIETTGRYIDIESPVVHGGRDASFCPSLTQDQINCYSKILDYIAIELGFNYENLTLEAPSYASVISNDNNLPITLEDGSSLDLDHGITGGTPPPDSGPTPALPRSRRRGSGSSSGGSSSGSSGSSSY